ncbi:MAG TPA: DMT family transporter [Dongiaceae bacterium]|jgi:drug/metabolite transporter (DMT)-like permease|nr:DMT family transporter [Dongiaceae bacterium]
MNAQQSLADRLALPILLLGAVSISFSGIFVKLSEVGPISTGFFRMSLPLPVMAIGLWISARQHPDRKLPRIDWRGWAGIQVAAFFLAFDLIVWHWSLKLIGVGVATLLGNTAPIWVALAGFVFFKERFSPRFLIGLGVALGGVVLLVLGGDRSLAVGDWLGLMLATLGAIGYAGYLRGVKAARARVGLAQVMFWTCACTALWLLPAALLTEDKIVPQTWHGWLAVAGLAFVSQTIGQGMISWALGHLPAAFSSVSLLLNPVASGVFAWMILGEALTGTQIGGGLAVLFGIFVARPRPRTATAEAFEDAPPPKPVAPST